MIQALGRLRNSHIHYVIAGTGDQADALKKLAVASGVNLHLLGYRSDVPELLKAADIYALPSLREGLNVSLMEAMASGLPCICGDIRGNQDLIDDGRGGYRVPGTDVSAWAVAITKLLHATPEFGQYNQKKIKIFSKELVEEKMRRLYEEVVL